MIQYSFNFAAHLALSPHIERDGGRGCHAEILIYELIAHRRGKLHVSLRERYLIT